MATPGLNFRRSESSTSTARGDADHCEGTGVGSILRRAALKAVSIALFEWYLITMLIVVAELKVDHECLIASRYIQVLSGPL